MNFIQKRTLGNFAAAGVMVVIGYCLQWIGLAILTERMNTALMVAILATYDWSAAQSAMVQFVYLGDVWYWRTVSQVTMCWSVLGLLLVIGTYRFISARLAAIMSVGLICGTFALSAPFSLTDAFWLSSTGQPSPMAVQTVASTEAFATDSPSKTAGSAEAADAPSKLHDIWTTSVASVPLEFVAYGLGGLAVVFNTVRLALICVIVLGIATVTIGTFKRRRDN